MDLRRLSLDRRLRQASVSFADSSSVASQLVEGAGFDRILGAAQPLFDWAHGRMPASARTPRDATLVAFDVDAIDRSLRLAYVAERAQGGPPIAASSVSPALNWSDVDYDSVHSQLREAARTAVREVRPTATSDEPADPEQRWEHIYQHGGDGWELGRPAPPLHRYLNPPPLAAGQRALVVGCGRGHDALSLAHRAKQVSAQVVAIDIAPTAVRTTAAAAAQAGLSDCLQAVAADLLATDGGTVLASATYDLIVEHTCFCAIEPSRRDDYLAAVRRLLKPGGHFVGLFYCHDYPGGPPYRSSAAEIRARFAAGTAFALCHEEVPIDSVLTRAGVEWLLDARRL